MTGNAVTGNTLTRALDAVTRGVGRVTAWLIIPMVASLVYEVTARYLFDAPTIWPSGAGGCTPASLAPCSTTLATIC